MNTLSMRDHSDDNERAVIAALLSETYEAPIRDDEPVEVMYVLNSDDAPDDTMFSAFEDAFLQMELDARDAADSPWADVLIEHQYEYLNAVSPAGGIVSSMAVDDREGEVSEVISASAITPDIGESALEIGENEAVTPQRGTVTLPYTVLAVTGTGTDGVSEYDDLDAAVDKLIENLGQLMTADPGCTYWEMITDPYTDSPEGLATIEGLSIGFVRGWTDEEDRACAESSLMCPKFDPTKLDRGVYLFVSDTNDDDEAYQTVNQYIRAKGLARMSTIGWEFTPVGEEMDGHCDRCNAPLVDEDRQCDDGGHCYCDQCGDSGGGETNVYCGNCGQLTKDDDAEHGHCYYCGNYKPDEGGPYDRVIPESLDHEPDAPCFNVSDNFDFHEQGVTLDRAIATFHEDMLQLLHAHPNTAFRPMYNELIVFGLELFRGDETWYDEGDATPGLFIEASDQARSGFEQMLRDDGELSGFIDPAIRAREVLYGLVKDALGITTNECNLTCNEIWEAEDVYLSLMGTEVQYPFFRAMDHRIEAAWEGQQQEK
jgi:hypothetical protein